MLIYDSDSLRLSTLKDQIKGKDKGFIADLLLFMYIHTKVRGVYNFKMSFCFHDTPYCPVSPIFSKIGKILVKPEVLWSNCPLA